MNYKSKAEQHYEMAGLAFRDGDKTDGARHLQKAKEYDALAKTGQTAKTGE